MGEAILRCSGGQQQRTAVAPAGTAGGPRRSVRPGLSYGGRCPGDACGGRSNISTKRRSRMTDPGQGALTRRRFLETAALAAALPLVGRASSVSAATKVHDFTTGA